MSQPKTHTGVIVTKDGEKAVQITDQVDANWHVAEELTYWTN